MKITNNKNKIDFIEKASFTPFLIKDANSFLTKLFLLFRLCIDTPHRSLITKFKKYSKDINGNVLDVGCGEGFYKRYLNKDVKYKGLEIEGSKNYFSNKNKDVVFYDGNKIPFDDSSQDNIICFEVLEHTFDYNNLVKEMNRVLKIDGNMYLSVPFAAKFHYIPWDFFRYTPTSLKMIMENNNFEIVNFQRRGADICVAFHFITVAILGMIVAKKPIQFIFGISLLPFAIFSSILANIAEYFDLGAPENTLGFFLVCKKL